MLAAAVCTDAFAAGTAYGAGGLDISSGAAAVISVTGGIVLGISLALSGILPSENGYARLAGGVMLILMGGWLFFGKGIKNFLHSKKRRKTVIKKKTKATLISLLIKIFSDETKADIDGSKGLSLKEAALLGTALSADSFAAGVTAGLGFTTLEKVFAVFAALLAGCPVIMGGWSLGKALSGKLPGKPDLSALGGVLIILLGIAQILGF